MDISIKGKRLDVGDALRSHVEDHLGAAVTKYFSKAHDAGPEESIPAQQYTLAPESGDDELPEEGQPAIIAELPTEIATLSVSEAVMRMDLADAPALMFRNRANGGLNVVYRRPDGNIGWIDPANTTHA